MKRKLLAAIAAAAMVLALVPGVLAGKPDRGWREVDLIPGPVGAASVAIDGSGGVHAVWQVRGQTQTSIDYSLYRDGRLTKTATIAVDPHYGYLSWPRIALGPGGAPFVVFEKMVDDTRTIMLAIGRKQWAVECLADDTSYRSPDIVVTSKGAVFVAAGTEGTREDGWIVVLTNESGSWEREVLTLPEPGRLVFFRGLTLTPDGQPALAFAVGSRVYVAERTPEGWATEMVAEFPAATLNHLVVLYPRGGQPIVVCTVTSSLGPPAVWAADKQAGGWTTYLFEASATQPVAVLDPKGVPYVVYIYTPGSGHGYGYRDPDSGLWVKDLLPPGPYNYNYYGNIVAGADAGHIHVFRTVGDLVDGQLRQQALQYLSHRLPLGR